MSFSIGLLLFGCGTGAPAAESVVIPVSSPDQQCTQWLSVTADGEVIERRSADATDACSDKQGTDATAFRTADDGKTPPVWTPIVVDPFGGGSGAPGGSLTPAAPQPWFADVDITATPGIVDAGNEATLEWEATDADVCLASGGWSGAVSPEGVSSTGPLTETTTFTLTCDGPGGMTSASVTVAVDAQYPPPTASLTAAPSEVTSGNSTTLTWSSQDADTCVASGDWSGTLAPSGARPSGPLTQTSTFVIDCTGPGGSTSASTTVTVTPGDNNVQATFNRITIEPDQAPWGKNFGDVNGDGYLDILEGGGSLGNNVYWYRYPDWQKFLIGTQSGGDDLQVADINGDGALDVVVNAAPVAWYENPAGSGGNPEGQWQHHQIASHRSHDIQIADINADGKPDVVLRMANSGFNPSARIYIQVTEDDWDVITLWSDNDGTGGLAVADVDGDGRLDVIGDGFWSRQPETGIMNGGNWVRYDIGPWPNGSSIDTADLNGDGNLDVTLAVSEVGIGAIAWYEAPDDPLTQPWVRHDIGTVEDVHRHHLVDINNDGDLDIVFAEMYQGAYDRVGIYNNDGTAMNWTLQVLETHASHNIAVGDVDNDGDIDIVGANWRPIAPAGGDLFLWINTLID